MATVNLNAEKNHLLLEPWCLRSFLFIILLLFIFLFPVLIGPGFLQEASVIVEISTQQVRTCPEQIDKEFLSGRTQLRFTKIEQELEHHVVAASVKHKLCLLCPLNTKYLVS